MTLSYTDVLTHEELQYLSTLPEVVQARASLETRPRGVIYLNVTLPQSIKDSLKERLGLDLSNVAKVPMRWIKGDTFPHIDNGPNAFETTYLMYVNSCPGELVVDGQNYPITQGTAYVFNEGLRHETVNTMEVPRLLLGPMSEQGMAVGFAFITYYNSEADALANLNLIAYNNIDYEIGNINWGSIGGITSWRIASNSSGTSSQSLVYTNGQTLNADGDFAYYFLYPAVPCFLEGTTILCEENGERKYVPVEQLRKGSLVKTLLHGFKKVDVIGYSKLKNPGTGERVQNRLYKCTTKQYPQLTKDLYLTGCHSILVNELTEEQREETKKQLGDIFVTDKKYRLIACVDERAEPWESEGEYTVWHFALENEDSGLNYGVFANGGLLVESCSLRFMNSKSNMTFV